MLEFSELEIEDLKLLRKFLLLRYVNTKPTEPNHVKYGKYADAVAIDLVRKTGNPKYKL